MDPSAPPVLHATLRDRATWRGTMVGLATDATGALTLERAPGPADGLPIELPGPYDVPASGIAVAPCGDIVAVDGEAQRIVVLTVCGDRVTLGRPGTGPGELTAPTGLAIAGDRLVVADTGNARLQLWAFPALNLAGLVEHRLTRPEALAAEHGGTFLVADRATGRLHRLGPGGWEDGAFAVAAGPFQDPRFATVGVEGWVLVADAGTNEVLALDAEGTTLGPVAPPAAGWQPRALLAVGQRLYVADAASGSIWLMDAPSGRWLGTLRGWRGPVAGLAATRDGDLLVKPGAAPIWQLLPHDAAFLPAGWLEAGPFDAGLENGWHILRASTEQPAGSRLTIACATLPSGASAPAPADWVDLPGPSALLEVVRPTAGSVEARRFLWVRADLESLAPAAAPRLSNLAAATAGERLIEHLPGFYARADGAWDDPPGTDSPRAFLRRLLELMGDGLAGAEAAIDVFPQRLDPAFAPAADLAWLAAWLDLDLPRRLDETARRALIGRAVALHARGGTPASLRAMAALHAGVAVRIEECFAARRIWILGEGQGLGFDTGLPLVDPEGLVVEGFGRPTGPAAAPCRPLLGHAVLGATTPIAEADVMEPLFAPTAHRFSVHLPPGAAGALDAVRAVVEREKPAHTDFSICATSAAMRIGWQARLGIDTVIAAGPEAGRLEAAVLGRDARLAMDPEAGARLGMGMVIGQGTRLG